MDNQLLKGRVALVTGGTTGIGFGAAERLIATGAFVYITGRRQGVLDEATAKLGASSHGLQAADASSKADMPTWRARRRTALSRLHVPKLERARLRRRS